VRQQLVDIVEHACFREFAAETAGLATLDERALRLLEAARARPPRSPWEIRAEWRVCAGARGA
jgi:hypothetical protein